MDLSRPALRHTQTPVIGTGSFPGVIGGQGVTRGRKPYIQWGAAWFPKGIVNNTAISTPVLRSVIPVAVYQNYSRSMIKEQQSKNTTIYVCTMTYQLHVSAVS